MTIINCEVFITLFPAAISSRLYPYDAISHTLILMWYSRRVREKYTCQNIKNCRVYAVSHAVSKCSSMQARKHYQLPSTRVSNSWCICCGWQIEAALSLLNALDIYLERRVSVEWSGGIRGSRSLRDDDRTIFWERGRITV